MSLLTLGQDTTMVKDYGVCDESGYCIPKIPGIRKSRGVSFNYLNSLSYDISSQNEDSTYQGKINRDRRYTIKLKIPVINEDHMKFVVGLKYAEEEFKFKTFDEGFAFHSALNQKPLRRFGITGYLINPFKSNRFLVSRANFRLSGDFDNGNPEDYLRISASSLYGIRSSYNSTWGIGITYSYSFGRQLIFPILAYAKKYNKYWSLETLIPVNLSLRFNASKKDAFEFLTRVSGDSYNIQFDDYNPDNLFLQSSDLFSGLTYERNVFSILWMSVGGGYRYNYSFDLFRENNFNQRSDPEFSNDVQSSWFVDVGVFLVAPDKWIK
ncbi:MAG: DUF6268 family outer membrane beta-barrel protein [Flavobacteriales bacterium]|nr:DUF6268 family outer membrane beta-barrel protein [Flavobacteriales bacterium]